MPTNPTRLPGNYHPRLSNLPGPFVKSWLRAESHCNQGQTRNGRILEALNPQDVGVIPSTKIKQSPPCYKSHPAYECSSDIKRYGVMISGGGAGWSHKLPGKFGEGLRLGF